MITNCLCEYNKLRKLQNVEHDKYKSIYIINGNMGLTEEKIIKIN